MAVHSEFDAGRLEEEIYLIRRGVRAVACLPIRAAFLEEALGRVAAEGLYALHAPCGAAHISLTLYAYPHLAAILPQIDALPEPLRSWAHGKLFGYSEAAIGDFLATREALP